MKIRTFCPGSEDKFLLQSPEKQEPERLPLSWPFRFHDSPLQNKVPSSTTRVSFSKGIVLSCSDVVSFNSLGIHWDAQVI